MKNITKKLVIAFLIIVIIKVILSLFVLSPSIFSYEYFYSKMAKGFAENLNFEISGKDINSYPPLYPIIQSIAYKLTDNSYLIYKIMQVINAIISSLIIIPAFLLSKEFFTEKKVFLISLLISVIPSAFAFSPYILSENLFYPLFLFSIYFMYKAFSENKSLYYILTGIFIALTFMTRLEGLVLIPIFIFTCIYHYTKINKSIKNTKDSAGMP